MIVQNNIMALNAQRQMQLNTLQLQSSLSKLSSGYRINSAADDAAGLAISERMRAQMTGVERAMLNAQDGSSLVATADGALGEVHSMLNRLSELGVQASNGILNNSQRASLQSEANQLLKEIDRISQATNFNGIQVLDGSLATNANQQAQVSGVQVDEIAATAGEYAFNSVTSLANLSAGDTVSVNLALNNGDSHTFDLTVNDDRTGFVTAGGETISFASSTDNGDGTVTVSGDDFAGAIASSLQGTSAAQYYNISADSGSLTLANKDTGLSEPQVSSLSFSTDAANWQRISGITTSAPSNTTYQIAQENLQVFDGTNESAATFSVNGSNFVLVNETGYAQAVSQLSSSDVNIIKVEGTQGNLTTDDLQAISATVNQKTGMAFEATADGITVKGVGGEGLSLQIGDTAAGYNKLTVNVSDMSSKGLGLGSISFASAESASRALDRINAAIDKVSSTRGDLGATQNRLDYTINSLGTTYENITAAESRVRDADMAKTMMDFVKKSILTQASTAMMAQANMQSQNVLQLLR